MPDTPLKLAALVAADLPSPDAPGWEASMRALITRGHTAAWLAGMSERLGVPLDSPLLSRQRLSRAEREEIKALVEKQLQYLKGFLADRADMSEAQIGARSSLYPGAVRATYYGARWGEWDIDPNLIPGNQDCITRCKCTMSVRDNGDGTGVLLREMHAEAHCASCPPLAGEHPIKRRGA